MSSSDWTFLTDSLSAGSVDRGITAGIARPNGGGDYIYGFNSLDVSEGAVGLFVNLAGFAPAASGLTVRGAIQRGASAGATNFAPMLFAALQGPSVNDTAYILGLGDADPHHIVLVKGALVDGVPDLSPDPDGNTVLLRSTATYEPGTWLHLRMDVIVQASGDVVIQCFQSDLDSNAVSAPDWTVIPGMEGDQYPTLTGFVDDSLGVNTGSAPLVGGRTGWAFQTTDVNRRGYFDHVTIGKQ